MPARIYNHPYDPFRSPAWRWLRACDLVEHNQRVSPKWDDGWVWEAVQFLKIARKDRHRTEGRPFPERLSSIREARDLYQSPDSFERMEIEGRLLAAEPFGQITAKVGCRPEVVQAFHELFFHVQERLRATDYIAIVVIGPKLHFGLNENDMDVIFKIHGYYQGGNILDSTVRYYREPPVLPANLESLSDAERNDLYDKLLTKAAIAARTLPIDGCASFTWVTFMRRRGGVGTRSRPRVWRR